MTYEKLQAGIRSPPRTNGNAVCVCDEHQERPTLAYLTMDGAAYREAIVELGRAIRGQQAQLLDAYRRVARRGIREYMQRIRSMREQMLDQGHGRELAGADSAIFQQSVGRMQPRQAGPHLTQGHTGTHGR